MRLYDRNQLKRFEKGHPVWDKYMITKKGNPRKNIDWGVVQHLLLAGKLSLLPSVSDVASCLDGFKMFGVGANWATGVTARQAQLVLEKYGAGKDFADVVKAESIREQTKARDIGTRLHWTFDAVAKGDIKVTELDEGQRKFVHACRCALHNDIDCPPGSYVTEKEVWLDFSAGTCDVHCPPSKIVVDWKTVKEFRQARESELAQLAAYTVATESTQGFLVQVHQGSMQYRVMPPLKGKKLTAYWDAFRKAASLYRSMLAIKINSAKARNPLDENTAVPQPSSSPEWDPAPEGFAL